MELVSLKSTGAYNEMGDGKKKDMRVADQQVGKNLTVPQYYSTSTRTWQQTH